MGVGGGPAVYFITGRVGWGGTPGPQDTFWQSLAVVAASIWQALRQRPLAQRLRTNAYEVWRQSLTASHSGSMQRTRCSERLALLSRGAWLAWLPRRIGFTETM